MGSFFGVVTGALVVVAFATLFVWCLLAGAAGLWVVRAQRADRHLREDLDRNLTLILSHPSSAQKGPSQHRAP